MSACTRVCNSMPALPISLYTFQRGDKRKRGGYGEPTPFPSVSAFFSLSRTPFLPLSFFYSLFVPPSLFLPFSSIMWCAASRTHIHAHSHTVPSDTRMWYAFLVGCIFQDCGLNSYSAPCNMHVVEGADCSVRSLRVQRARAQRVRQRKREIVDTVRMAAPRRGRG